MVAAVLAAASIAGALAADRRAVTLAAHVPEGRQTIAGRVHTDPQPTRRGFAFLLSPTHLRTGGEWRLWRGPRLSVQVDGDVEVAAGRRAWIAGVVRSDPHLRRGDPVAATVSADRVVALGPASDPLFRVGNLLRARVERGLDGFRPDPAAALLSGFLIGDVRDLPGGDENALRRAGLSHFVAVSGSNVALFLAAWWLVAGPFAAGPRARAVLGIAGLAIFVVVTRWEPSVVRAATMAGLVLTGRLVGLPLDAWTALGWAATLLVLISADLTLDPGFQLSVAATAGVIAGARMFAGRRPRWTWALLGATVAAQLAVAPLLLLHFGTLPLLAPVANAVAGPLVAAATTAGGIGVVTGIEPVTRVGVGLATGVLEIARIAAGWPQLDAAGVVVVVGVLALAAVRRVRPLVVLAAAVAVAFGVGWQPGPPPVPTAVFLDVGQGDAALLLGRAGEVILVDGGPDPARLLEGLRRHGVRRVDLMVASHGHADHVTGLTAVVESLPVGRLWHSGRADSELAAALVTAAESHGIAVEVVAHGWSASVGELTVEVLGPMRRYASPNDESVVLRVSAGGSSVLLPGDVEAIAQADLGSQPADVLKVPHQGAATSDLDWLRASAGGVAVISVGPNPFGHPSDDVIAALEDTGVRVLRTDREGDVVLPLDGSGHRSP